MSVDINLTEIKVCFRNPSMDRSQQMCCRLAGALPVRQDVADMSTDYNYIGFCWPSSLLR